MLDIYFFLFYFIWLNDGIDKAVKPDEYGIEIAFRGIDFIGERTFSTTVANFKVHGESPFPCLKMAGDRQQYCQPPTVCRNWETSYMM